MKEKKYVISKRARDLKKDDIILVNDGKKAFALEADGTASKKNIASSLTVVAVNVLSYSKNYLIECVNDLEEYKVLTLEGYKTLVDVLVSEDELPQSDEA